MSAIQEKGGADVESGRAMTKISHWRMLFDRGALTPEIENHQYAGAGTKEDPYMVTWIPNDPRDPMRFPNSYKWICTLGMALSVLAVSLDSSAYSGGTMQSLLTTALT
jgi:hypothetical protein